MLITVITNDLKHDDVYRLSCRLIRVSLNLQQRSTIHRTSRSVIRAIGEPLAPADRCHCSMVVRVATSSSCAWKNERERVSSLVRDVPPVRHFRFCDLDRSLRPWGSIVGNTIGELFAATATTVIVVVVDVVDQGPDSQAPRIGRAAFLSAPLRELRAGQRILGDSRTDDGIYYGLHVFQRYQPVSSVSRSVPFEVELSRNPAPKVIAGGYTMYMRVCMCVYTHMMSLVSIDRSIKCLKMEVETSARIIIFNIFSKNTFFN